MPGKLLILDMDGTLVNVEARLNMCQKLSQSNKRAFWNCFLSTQYMDLDTPNVRVIEFVKSLIDPSTTIIIVSGRTEDQRTKTVEQLTKIGIMPTEIKLRQKGDYRKDYEYKTSIIKELIEKYQPEKTIVIDDSDDVLKSIKQNLPQVDVIDAKSLLNS